jgi:hypothetical protein
MGEAHKLEERRLVTGLFRNRESAERAYQTLEDHGYLSDDISVMMLDETRKNHYDITPMETEHGNKAMKGAGMGGAIGGTVGAALAAIAAAGASIALPGLGLMIAGPVAAALAGAGAGGATGGLIGALVGAGISEDRVKMYEVGIREGGILLGVHARSEAEAQHIESLWRDVDGYVTESAD